MRLPPAPGVLVALGVALAACGAPAPIDGPAFAPLVEVAVTPDPSFVADSVVIVDSTHLFFVRYRYPQLRDAGPHTDAVNRAIVDSVRATIEVYRPEGPPPERSYRFTTDLDAGFDVHRLDADLFSVVTSFYTYTGGAHGNQHTEVLNVDLVTGRPFGLADLFRPGASYLDTLSATADGWILQEAPRRRATRDDYWEEGWAPESSNFARFTVGTDSLRFYFPPYQIAPYVAGSFAMSVPLTRLQSLLAEERPATVLHR